MSSTSLVVSPAVNGGWKLPFDVVLDIMAVSQCSTISALMKTCHTLYTEGPKYLLCDGVQLNLQDDIIKFSNFMLTEDPSRFTHLRELVLGVGYLGVTLPDQTRFVDFLAHPCLALETLILHHADVFMGCHAPLPMQEAFCKLKTIKRLVVLDVREESARVIQRLSSPLESISIGVEVGVGRPFDFLSTLTSFSDTLHTLLINSQPSTSQPSTSAFSLFQNARFCKFPRISTFGIVWDDSVPELLASPIFAQAFPAISHLKLIPSEHPSIGFSQRSAWRFRGPESRVRPPLGLDECSGELCSVSTLGFDCTLSTLRLWQPVHFGELPALSAVLEGTRPRHLYLVASVDDVAGVFATLRTLRTRAPPCIDLAILGPWTLGVGGIVSEKALERLCSPLKALFNQPPPPGLVELSLLFGGLASGGLHRHRQPLTREFTRWASTASPPLTLTWKSSIEPDEEQLHWPDLGQRGDNFYTYGYDDGDYDDGDYDGADYDDDVEYDDGADYDGVDYVGNADYDGVDYVGNADYDDDVHYVDDADYYDDGIYSIDDDGDYDSDYSDYDLEELIALARRMVMNTTRANGDRVIEARHKSSCRCNDVLKFM